MATQSKLKMPGKEKRLTKLSKVVEMVEENDNLTEVTVRVLIELGVKGFDKPKEDKKEGTKTKTSKPKVMKGPRVIATIVATLVDAGKEGITKKEIHNVLVKTFPDRKAASMWVTVNAQVPSRISKERFNVLKTKDGRYYKG